MFNSLNDAVCQRTAGKTVGKDIADFKPDRSFLYGKFQFRLRFGKKEKFPDTAAAADFS